MKIPKNLTLALVIGDKLKTLSAITELHHHSQLYMTYTKDRSLAEKVGLGKTPLQSQVQWYEENFLNK